MTRHDDIVRLRHMLDHAREAVAMLAGKERADLRSERMLELALVRLIEIMGEAAARVSPESQERYPLIPWREVVGMRTGSLAVRRRLLKSADGKPSVSFTLPNSPSVCEWLSRACQDQSLRYSVAST